MYKKTEIEIVVTSNIKKLRKSLGLTLDEFSNKLGISSNTYQTYEYNQRKIPVWLLHKIASTFGIEDYNIFFYA